MRVIGYKPETLCIRCNSVDCGRPGGGFGNRKTRWRPCSFRKMAARSLFFVNYSEISVRILLRSEYMVLLTK